MPESLAIPPKNAAVVLVVATVVIVVAMVTALSTAPPAGARTRCPAGVKPTHLAFRRATGKHTGRLEWRAGHRARSRAGHRSAPRLRYQVLRGHKLVGKTARHTLRIRVRLNHTYRFTVIPARAARLPRACAARRRVHVTYRLPGKPAHLRLSGKGASRRATWRRARPGDGGLAGYRLERDHRKLARTRHTAARVRVAPGHTYRFVVVAVDKHGRVSAPSNAVVVKTTSTAPSSPPPPQPQVAPTVPARVQARALSSSAVTVSWAPSSATGAAIVGYRVLRNGAVVHQYTGSSATLTDLRPSTTYTITVVAVASDGVLSAPSAPVKVATSAPSRVHTQGFLLADSDQSFIDFQEHYKEIGVIYPTYYTCNGAGALEGTDNVKWTKWAQARGVKVLPRINCQSASVVNDILTDSALRTKWLDQLVQLVDDNDYDGLAIDFESGPAADRAALTSFITDLAQSLHAHGKLLSMSISATTGNNSQAPRSGIYDYQALGQVVDYPVVMAWGLHWATSAPGSQDDIRWVREVLSYVSSLPDHAKFIAGFNLYAMDWPDGGGTAHPADTYQFDALQPTLTEFGGSARRDPVTDSMRATYTADGVPHEVWFEDGATEADRIRLAADDGLAGVAFWRLGAEDPYLWNDPLLEPGSF